MIIDFADCKSNSFQADVCIIGAGIAAYSILSVLKNTKATVLVLERGSMKQEPVEVQSKSCEITGHPFLGHILGRQFGVGGTSEAWGGQALSYTPFDIKKKDWIANSGWPIPMDEISKYYREAERLLALDDFSYDSKLHNLQRLPDLGIDEAELKTHFSKWSPKPNLKHSIINLCKSDANITLLLNAACRKIRKAIDSDNVHEVEVQSAKNHPGKVKANIFILATGGIENARILLMSPSLHADHTFVGRMFQDHPTSQVATVVPENETQLQQHFNYFYKGHTRILPRLSLSEDIQTREKLLAATGFIQFIPPTNGLFEASRDLYRKIIRLKTPSRKEIANLLFKFNDISTLSKMALAYLSHRRVFTPRGTARLTIMVEQEPVVESYIGLSGEVDSTGLPLPKINWHITKASIATLKRFCAILESEFTRLNLGKIEWDSWLIKDDDEIQQHLIDAYHHMGTTRMSQTISTGVVDENCKMHGIHNLYISGSSVFPTTGHSNPTLTIMALAIRLAHYLKKELTI